MKSVQFGGWQMQTAERFGAKVSIGLPGRGMFLLEAAEPEGLDVLVRSVGAQVVARIGAGKALVVMGVASYMGLRGSRAVRFIGPVNVEQQRLAAVLGALNVSLNAPVSSVS
ncbi:MAG: hypothetical protein ABIP34_08105 [Rhodoferax sp.]|uniref:hypothetical protein n=1 Tax=Rhodoferax sp. TaxID=50421 RepID=UPI00326695AA